MDKKWKLIVVLSWVVLLAVIGFQHVIFQQKLEYMQGYVEGYVQGYIPAYIHAQDEQKARTGGVTIPNPLYQPPADK